MYFPLKPPSLTAVPQPCCMVHHTGFFPTPGTPQVGFLPSPLFSGDRIVDPRIVDPRIVDPRMVDPKES